MLRMVSGEGAYQNVINRPEAEIIVNKIQECLKSSNYKEKTIGVISLQGYAQARLIEKMLLDEIGPEAIENRHIVCGSAYDFQGDERDIIFLSMVAATNERIGVFTKESDKRRFNVAASRARDQVWLIHSVTPNDLNQNCFRSRLLSYYLNPKREQQEVDDGVFESDFERDVFSDIKNKGYKVIPQFRVAEYRIDLVIEGMEKRLAVECDGDKWHGSEEFESDMKRQRILERAGWIFWRIRGSEYYRNKEHSLEGLWQVLEEMGIYSSFEHKRIVEERKEQERAQLEEREDDLLVTDSIPETEEEQEKDRLSAAINYAQNKQRLDGNRVDKIKIKNILLGFLKESSQGKDLIADKVIRRMMIRCKGRNRTSLRKRISRVITDLKRNGIIVEYETDKRKRIKLKEKDLFD